MSVAKPFVKVFDLRFAVFLLLPCILKLFVNASGTFFISIELLVFFNEVSYLGRLAGLLSFNHVVVEPGLPDFRHKLLIRLLQIHDLCLCLLEKACGLRQFFC
jgi:hypothetical protein